MTREVVEELYQSDQCQSQGEDLELYFQRITNGTIYQETEVKRGESKDTFLLNLLDPKDEQKLERNDPEYRKTFKSYDPDIPFETMEASKSMLKFSRSDGKRQTRFILI